MKILKRHIHIGFLSISAILLSNLFFWGCENQPTELEDYNPQPILTAFIFNGEPVESVRLEWVAPLYSYYQPSDWGISDAEIILFPVGNPSADDTLHFVESANPDSHGVYIPVPSESLIPQGKVRYRIEVRKPSDGINLWAETMVPDTFSMMESPYEVINNSISIPLDWNDPIMTLNWTIPDSADGFIATTFCLTPYDSLITLDPDADLDEQENPQQLGIINIGPTTLELPWILFSWVGWHKIELQATGTDYLEYCQSVLYTQNVDPIFNIHGGIGIFAGFSRHYYFVYLQRAQ